MKSTSKESRISARKEQERLDTMSKFDIMLEEIRKSAKESKDEYIRLLESALTDVLDGVRDHEIENDYGLTEDDAFRCIAVRMVAQESLKAAK